MMAHMAGEPESLQPTHFHTGAIALHFTDQVSRVSVRRREQRGAGAAPQQFRLQDVMSAGAAQPITSFTYDLSSQ
jgi:hypothetical protein